MTLNQIIDKLRNEINTKNRKDVVDSFEDILTENLKELANVRNFYQLPLSNIISIISKAKFDSNDEDDESYEVLQNFIKNIIETHVDEKETLLILQSIDISQMSLSYAKTISILKMFTNCPFFQHLCSLYDNEQQLLVRDFGDEIKQKDQEIKKLKQQVTELKSDQVLKAIEEINALKETVNTLKMKLGDYESPLRILQNSMDELKIRVESLEQREHDDVDELKDEVKDIKNKDEMQDSYLKKLKRAVNILRQGNSFINSD